MSQLVRKRRRALVLFVAWCALTAAGVALFRQQPYRHPGVDRLGSRDAAVLAVSALRREGYGEPVVAVHATRTAAGELGPGRRWLVLCRLQNGELIVVELDLETGRFLRTRAPRF